MSKIQQLEKQIQDQMDILQDFECRLHELKGDGQEVEEGQWVWAHNDIFLFYWESTSDRGACGYGFDGGVWDEGAYWCSVDSITRPATKDEVSEALIAEAKRRGLVEGAKCKRTWETFGSLDNPIVPLTDNCFSDEYKYEHERDRLLCYGYEIYRQGDWAEIIEPSEEPIEINGHEAKFLENYVEVGCAIISNEWFKETAAISEKYDVYLSRKGEDITKQIHQIAKKL